MSEPNVFSITSDDEGNFNADYPEFLKEYGLPEREYRDTLKLFAQTVSDFKSRKLMALIVYGMLGLFWLMIAMGLALLIIPIPLVILSLIIMIIMFVAHYKSMKKEFQKELSAYVGKENREKYLSKGLFLDYKMKPQSMSYYQEGGHVNGETLMCYEILIICKQPPLESVDKNVNLQASAPPMPNQPYQQNILPQQQPIINQHVNYGIVGNANQLFGPAISLGIGGSVGIGLGFAAPPMMVVSGGTSSFGQPFQQSFGQPFQQTYVQPLF